MKEQEAPRKNKTLFWLGAIIFVGLLIIVALYLYWKYNDSDVRQPENYGKVGQQKDIISSVNKYISWADSLPDKKMNLDHTLTSAGLNKIADVLELYANVSVDGKYGQNNDIMFIRSMADSVSVNWKSGRHTDMIKAALLKTVDTISDETSGGAAQLKNELAVLREKIAEIDRETLTLNQRDDVKDAFKQVAIVFNELK